MLDVKEKPKTETIDVEDITVIGEETSPVQCTNCLSYVFTPPLDADFYTCYSCGGSHVGVNYNQVHPDAVDRILFPSLTSWWIASDRPRWHVGCGVNDEIIELFPEDFARDTAAGIAGVSSSSYLYELEITGEYGGIVEAGEETDPDHFYVSPDVLYDIGSVYATVSRKHVTVLNRWKVTSQGLELKNRRR